MVFHRALFHFNYYSLMMIIPKKIYSSLLCWWFCTTQCCFDKGTVQQEWYNSRLEPQNTQPLTCLSLLHSLQPCTYLCCMILWHSIFLFCMRHSLPTFNVKSQLEFPNLISNHFVGSVRPIWLSNTVLCYTWSCVHFSLLLTTPSALGSTKPWD